MSTAPAASVADRARRLAVFVADSDTDRIEPTGRMVNHTHPRSYGGSAPGGSPQMRKETTHD